MIKRRRDRSADEPIMDLTPLIDVVFVVLVGFVLVAPLLDHDRVQLARRNPELGASSYDGQSGLEIKVTADDSIYVGGKQMDTSQLALVLKRLLLENPKVIPTLVQDQRATFGRYQEVKQICECCGFEQLDIVLQPGH